MAIFKRGKTYRVQIYVKRSDGGYDKKSATAKTKREARDLEAILRERASAAGSLSEISFDTMAKEYLRSIYGSMRSSTFLQYEKNLRNHVIPVFGKSRMQDITAGMINRWKKNMSSEISGRTGRHYKTQYLNTIYKVFVQVFRFAHRNYGVSEDEISKCSAFRDNPDEAKPVEQIKYWSPEQFSLWFNAFSHGCSALGPGDPLFIEMNGTLTLLSICFFAGLRKGEANALTIDSFIDGDYPAVRVSKSVDQKSKNIRKVARSLGISNQEISAKSTKSSLRNGYMVTPPKSKCSLRDIPIPSQLATIIRNQIKRVRMLTEKPDDSLFICGGLMPIPDQSIFNFKERYENQVGLFHIPIHDLRHSYVSMLANNHISIETVSKLVGHSDPRITWEIYAHIYPKTKSDAVDSLDSMTPDLIISDDHKSGSEKNSTILAPQNKKGPF